MRRRWWGVAEVAPCPGVALPSSLTCEREGNTWGHGMGRRLGMCPAGPAQSSFVLVGGGGTGHSACPSTSSICTGMWRSGCYRRTKGCTEAGHPAPILPTHLGTLGQAGPQGLELPHRDGARVAWWCLFFFFCVGDAQEEECAPFSSPFTA